MDYFRREKSSNGPLKINFQRLSRVSIRKRRVEDTRFNLDRKNRHADARRASDSRGRSSSPKTSTVAIFNLSYKADEREINRIFGRYGPIKNCNVVGGRNSRSSRSSTGFAFITYERMEDCKEAKEDAHGMEIDGNIIRTDFCISDGQRRKRRDYYVSPERGSRRHGMEIAEDTARAVKNIVATDDRHRLTVYAAIEDDLVPEIDTIRRKKPPRP
ncbi:unnamed protein product [Oikopleura dioica]|uniref:RRM domain-containing protein n=1 Tax=Oikopleura dioica TaxID=34765 RepID=E4XU80_OIKDI|nr:unnamed protein product [Oikopleura dioica]